MQAAVLKDPHMKTRHLGAPLTAPVTWASGDR